VPGKFAYEMHVDRHDGRRGLNPVEVAPTDFIRYGLLCYCCQATWCVEVPEGVEPMSRACP
jgi:hypothetical protein